MTWEEIVAPALKRAKGNTIEEIYEGLEKGWFHLWRGENAAIVSEFVVSPRHKALNAWLIAGDGAEIERMRPHIEAWAKSQGCDEIGGNGRKGWIRRLKSAGYRPVADAVVKEL